MDVRSIDLDEIRSLVPHHRLAHDEALIVAEIQAMRLLELAAVTAPPVPVHLLARWSGVTVTYHPSIDELGAAATGEGRWYIWHSHRDQANFQATIAHQLKFIVDEPFGDKLYPHLDVMTPRVRRHHAAEYFAACLILPQPWVEQATAHGERDVPGLARQFAVTTSVMSFRLQALRRWPEPLRP